MAEKSPLVSIVTPCRNSAAYIRLAIESVLAQDYANIEYIVIDGGSTDGTLHILREYGSRLKYYSGPDASAPDAINKGFLRSSGSIFGWLSADDTYYPGAVGAAAAALSEDESAGVVYGKAHWVDERGQTIRPYPTQPFAAEKLTRECIICQPASFLRREAFRDVDMLDVAEPLVFDYDLWIRLARRCRFRYVEQYWATSRMHRANITLSRRGPVLKANMRLLQKHYGYVPSPWIYGYCNYLLDPRDQFFQPLRHSPVAYTAALFVGLFRNWRHSGSYLRDWLSAPLRALKGIPKAMLS